MQATPYLSRPLPRAFIFGSFFFVTLPLIAYLTAVARSTTKAEFDVPVPIQVYSVVLGVTHFVLTFAIYLSSENRRHFGATPRGVFAFWVAPLAPAVFLATWYGLKLDVQFVVAATAVSFAIRLLDFLHVSRQAFGVLQLMKGPARAHLPKWAGRVENGHFLSMTALLFWSFVNDSNLTRHATVSVLIGGVTAAFFIATTVAYSIAFARGGDRRALGVAFAYFCVQTLALSLAVYRIAYYACALAVHYVEYHFIMGRRVLKGPVEQGDRVLGAVQRSPLLLYVSLLLLSVGGFAICRSPAIFDSVPVAQRALVHLFDGLFVFHYVIEMSIWKLSAPYFRKSLAPLYS